MPPDAKKPAVEPVDPDEMEELGSELPKKASKIKKRSTDPEEVPVWVKAMQEDLTETIKSLLDSSSSPQDLPNQAPVQKIPVPPTPVEPEEMLGLQLEEDQRTIQPHNKPRSLWDRIFWG